MPKRLWPCWHTYIICMCHIAGEPATPRSICRDLPEGSICSSKYFCLHCQCLVGLSPPILDRDTAEACHRSPCGPIRPCSGQAPARVPLICYTPILYRDVCGFSDYDDRVWFGAPIADAKNKKSAPSPSNPNTTSLHLTFIKRDSIWHGVRRRLVRDKRRNDTS
jgi:hypothetical protein